MFIRQTSTAHTQHTRRNEKAHLPQHRRQKPPHHKAEIHISTRGGKKAKRPTLDSVLVHRRDHRRRRKGRDPRAKEPSEHHRCKALRAEERTAADDGASLTLERRPGSTPCTSGPRSTAFSRRHRRRTPDPHTGNLEPSTGKEDALCKPTPPPEAASTGELLYRPPLTPRRRRSKRRRSGAGVGRTLFRRAGAAHA